METEAPPQVIECDGCFGRGFVKGPVDENTGLRITRHHDRCNGAGILILKEWNGGEPVYRALKLS